MFLNKWLNTGYKNPDRLHFGSRSLIIQLPANAVKTIFASQIIYILLHTNALHMYVLNIVNRCIAYKKYVANCGGNPVVKPCSLSVYGM